MRSVLEACPAIRPREAGDRLLERASPAKRLQRCSALRAAPAALALCLLLTACPPPVTLVPPPPETALPEPDPAAAPRATVTAFLDAVGAARSEEAYLLLSGRWRAQLTPERLAADLAGGGPLAADRLARARLAARGTPLLAGASCSFPIGEGHAVRLLLEADGWKLDTLE